MSTVFARFNYKPSNTTTVQLEAKLQQYEEALSDAAVEGYAGEFEFFYAEKDGVVGISVPIAHDSTQLKAVEAGSVLGYCMAKLEASSLDRGGESWISIHTPDDQTVISPK